MDDMANWNSKREALRGAEVLAFDLIFAVLTSQQLAELLTAPLERAAAKGNRDLAQRLVGAGAGIGEALHEAVYGGHGEIVSDLVESGASIAAKDAHGRTPLHVAARHGQTEVAQLLLLKGADKDAFDNEERTPLHIAVCREFSAIVLALLTAGADVSVRSGQTKIPLIHAAASTGSREILQAVIEHGADVDAVDASGYTALHLASASDKLEAIDVLLEAGVNINARNCRGRTALYSACFNQSHEALLCLLEHGATVNAKANDLETPLMCSAVNAGTQGAAEVVDSLLRAGADETIVDANGSRALDLIGLAGEEKEGRLAEDVERVRELLANAPADRVWRRRGYLVLCRAHSDRVHQSQVISSTHHADTAQAEGSGEQETVGGGNVDEIDGGYWVVVVVEVLRLQEEGIFRTVVGYL